MDWFSLDDELSKLGDDKRQKIQKIDRRCSADKRLNFFKLSIYKWDLNDAIKFYKNDKFCWNYCIYQKCKNKNKCQYHHNDNMKLYNMIENEDNTDKDYKYIEILIEYLLSLEKYKNNSMVYRYYARLHYQMNNIDKSEQLYLKSIEIDPNNGGAHNDYAVLLHYKKEDFDNAKIHYQKAIDLDPNYDVYNGNMANFLCSKMHKYSESLVFSTKAVSLTNKDGDWTYLVGEAYYNLKQWSLAKEYYTKTLKLGNAGSYDYDKEKVEAKIDKINKMMREASEKWHHTLSDNMVNNIISSDQTKQTEFYRGCLDAAALFNDETNIYLLLFAIQQLNLSNKTFKDAITQTGKDKLQTLRNIIAGIIAKLIDLMNQTEKCHKKGNEEVEEHNIEWKHLVLKQLMGQAKGEFDEDEKKQETSATTESNKELEIQESWQRDLDQIMEVSNQSTEELNLEEFSKVVKVAATQKRRLRTKFYKKISTMNQNLFDIQANIQDTQNLINKSRETRDDITKKLEATEKEYETQWTHLNDCFENCCNATENIKEYQTIIAECNKNLSHNEQQLVCFNEAKKSLTTSIENHREFETKNYHFIETVNHKYDEKWKKFETQWNKWDVKQIILYLKYKTNTLISDNNYNNNNNEDEKGDEKSDDSINWIKMEATMEEEKFKGKYLNSIDKSDLKSFGIKNFGKRNDIYKIIKKLCKNNPIPSDDEVEGDDCQGQVIMTSNNNTERKIDSKYLCPLTNKLMKDPVIAFDGNCYEKEAIIEYIQKHKQSPVTKQKVDNAQWAISLLYSSKSVKEEINEKFFNQ